MLTITTEAGLEDVVESGNDVVDHVLISHDLQIVGYGSIQRNPTTSLLLQGQQLQHRTHNNSRRGFYPARRYLHLCYVSHYAFAGQGRDLVEPQVVVSPLMCNHHHDHDLCWRGPGMFTLLSSSSSLWPSYCSPSQLGSGSAFLLVSFLFPLLLSHTQCASMHDGCLGA